MNGRSTITINGQAIELKFGMYANRVFAEKTKDGTGFTEDSFNEVGTSYLLYAGYLNACIEDESKPELKFRDFVEYVENGTLEGDTKEMTEAVTEWTKSRFVQKAVDNMKAAEIKKKKSTGTKSSKSRSVK